MSEKSITQKISKGDTGQDSISKDEIDQLSDMIFDCMADENPNVEPCTGPVGGAKEDDTGEFEPIKDTD